MKKINIVGIIIIVLCLFGCGNANINSNKVDCEGASIGETIDTSSETDESYKENSKFDTNTESDVNSEPVTNTEIGYDNNEALLNWDELTLSPTDEIDLMYYDDNVYSITVKRIYMAEGAAHPVRYFYGITVDRETKNIVYLKEYIPSFGTLIQIVESGKYEVVYGEFHVNSKEEIVAHLRKIYKEEDWGTYYLNYYIDGDYIYIIAKETFGYYSILKLKR